MTTIKYQNMKNQTAVISILVDALGWELVKEYKFLSCVTPFKTGLTTVLGFSSSAVPTVLAGISGDKMELWNSAYYSPETSPYKWLNWFKWVPDIFKENRYSRFIIRHFSRRLARHKGYFSDFAIPVKYLPQFDLCEKRNIYAIGGLIGKQSIFDDLDRLGEPCKIYSYVEYANDDKIFTQARQDISKADSRIFYLYLCQLDAYLHEHVLEKDKVKQMVKWYETKITDLFTHAKKNYRKVVLHVFSDHGMVPTISTVELIKTINTLGFSEGKDFAAMYDSTMARFWFMSDDCKKAILQILESLDCGDIVSDQTLKDEGAFFKDRRFGETIFLMKPGMLICPSYMSYTPVQGMHGYSPKDRFMEASYLSNVVPKNAPQHIIDIKKTIIQTI